ncbi:hypothetical protein INR49_011566 [Caranx melampygus]|nr:hypothetical protein INR49_011566 [Caranx melampygus]
MDRATSPAWPLPLSPNLVLFQGRCIKPYPVPDGDPCDPVGGERTIRGPVLEISQSPISEEMFSTAATDPQEGRGQWTPVRANMAPKLSSQPSTVETEHLHVG